MTRLGSGLRIITIALCGWGLLSTAACGGGELEGTTEGPTFGPELNADSFCGTPAIDAATERAFFIYEDCSTGLWHVVATAGGSRGSYLGRIVADQPLTLVGRRSVETSDRVEQITSTEIVFELTMTSPWLDGFDFTFPEGASVRLEVQADDGAPIRVGAAKEIANSPVQLGEPPAPSCGAPALDAANLAALYLFKECESSAWHLRGTAGGGSATYAGEIVVDKPLSSVQPYRLEGGDLLDTSDSQRIAFRFSMVKSYLDGVDFVLPAGASARILLSQGGPLLVGEEAQSESLPYAFGEADEDAVVDPPPVSDTLDPAGCDPMTDTQLQAAGYEPVRAHGAVADDAQDDSDAIQSAIDAAHAKRRVVYFHPGTYLVSKQLFARQDIFETNSNDGTGRYGNVLVGSYCGKEQPTLRLRDGAAPETNERVISAEPFAVITLWRPNSVGSPPDDTHGGRDWNQLVRNLKIVLGDNPGAVGIRHAGAEGCSAQEVTIDARGAFAGLYQINASGGYTYDVEVIGGQYGLYVPNHRGGSALVVGLKLSGQIKAPIAIDNYTPLTLVGAEIEHEGGPIITTIVGAEGAFEISGDLRTTFHDSGGHLSLVDSRIDLQGNASAAIANTERSIYLRNVYVRGAANVLTNRSPGGALKTADAAVWSQIGEYAYAGVYGTTYGEQGKLLFGANTDDTFYDGRRIAAASDVVVAGQASPPATLRTQHLYEKALCNVEGKGVVLVTSHGADPNAPNDDTAGIQAAIDAAAASGSDRVFLPAGSANSARAVSNKYVVTGTLRLGNRTRLCGVSRFSSIIDVGSWQPESDAPVIATPDDAAAKSVIADFKIELPVVGGSALRGYAPHTYALLWQAGRDSLYRDVWTMRLWGDPGDRRTIVIRGNGGGRYFGVTLHGGYLPRDVDASAEEDRPFTDDSGQLVLSPEAQHLLIEGTREPLTFYPFHLQHMTQPRGALATIRNAENVTIYGMKSEMGSVPEQMNVIVRSNPADLVPVWMRIEGSRNVSLIGHEGMAQAAAGRGMVEIESSAGVTLANFGRRANGVVVSSAAVSQDRWYFVKERSASATHAVTAQGFLSLFKSVD